MLVVTGKRKVKSIFRESCWTERLLLLPADVQRVGSTKRSSRLIHRTRLRSGHCTTHTKDAFWLLLHYIILYLCSHPSALHQIESLHLSHNLYGLNRTEGGPHTKANRRNYCVTPVSLASCPLGEDKSNCPLASPLPPETTLSSSSRSSFSFFFNKEKKKDKPKKRPL